HHVLNAEVLQLDERVLGLVAGESRAQQVRYSLDPEPALDRRAQAQRSRTLTLDMAPQRAVGQLLVRYLRRVSSHVDERRLELNQLLDCLHHLVNRSTAQGRNDLKGN